MEKVRTTGKFLSYGMVSNAGPQRTTHKGWHLRELRIGKKRMRREARKAIKQNLEEIDDEIFTADTAD